MTLKTVSLLLAVLLVGTCSAKKGGRHGRHGADNLLHEMCEDDVKTYCPRPEHHHNHTHGHHHDGPSSHNHTHGHHHDGHHGGPPAQLRQCIEEHKASFHAECITALDGDDHSKVHDACKADFETYCPRPEHGRTLRGKKGGKGGRHHGGHGKDSTQDPHKRFDELHQCIEEHKVSFSEGCQTAMATHEANADTHVSDEHSKMAMPTASSTLAYSMVQAEDDEHRRHHGHHRTTLVIGASLGGLTVLAAAIFAVRRRRQNRRTINELAEDSEELPDKSVVVVGAAIVGTAQGPCCVAAPAVKTVV